LTQKAGCPEETSTQLSFSILHQTFRRRILLFGVILEKCYDNAQAESFFSRFKAELLENGIFETVEDAKSEVFSYIEGYYNRIRLHSGIGYRSPLEYEKHLENKIRRSRESFVC
jgi:transposase InsO family protein